MSYLVLARKYRPQSFDAVVGQNPVSQTLLNALETGRVAHAYIFSGPRGVGKTTTARILAKCLNCVKGPTKTPCNQCDACISISQSNSTDDVLEIDGASNRGIEQIRELRENAKYAPARSRYRIFIIDEAHQITKDAFGALLKTLEEPPDHVVFMMATTEVQKIPAPILSRCQRFSLRPIPANLVFKHLKEICKKESIKVEEEALANIVRFVEGSLRDALSLLDQALVFSPNGITTQTVRDLLGLLPIDLIRGFAKRLRAGDPAEILRTVNDFLQDGTDLTQLAKDLQSFYHHLILAKAGVEDTFKVESEVTSKEAAEYDFPLLERNIRLLSKALEDMRHSDTPRAVFEIFALRLGQKTLDAASLVDRLEKMASVSPMAPVASLPPNAPFKREEPLPRFGPPKMTPPPPVSTTSAAAAPPVSPAKPAAPDTDTISDKELKAGWPEFINDVSAVKGTVAASLVDAAPASDGKHVTLTFSKSFHHDMVQKSLDLLKPIFMQRFGATPPIETRVDKSAAPADPSPAASAPPRAAAPPSLPPATDEPEMFEEVSPAEVNPDIQKALKHFPGTVKKGKLK